METKLQTLLKAVMAISALEEFNIIGDAEEHFKDKDSTDFLAKYEKFLMTKFLPANFSELEADEQLKLATELESKMKAEMLAIAVETIKEAFDMVEEEMGNE